MKQYVLGIAACVAAMTLAADEAALPGTFDYTVGDAKVTVLAECQQRIGRDKLVGATDAIMKQYAPEGTVPNAINAFLVRIGEKKILVDTGLGLKLVENLRSAGVDAGDIDAVLITHMHRDHIGGLLRDGAAVFTNATLYIARREFDYWQGKGTDARNIEKASHGRMRLFHPQELDDTDPKPLIRGVTAFAAYGHTPGHTVFLVDGQTKKLMIWGDITHATAVQVPHPEVAVTYDVDPAQAIEARRKVFAYIMKHTIDAVGGMHIAYPGVATLGQDEGTGKFYLYPKDYAYTDKASGRAIAVRSDGYCTETEKVADGAAKGKILRLTESNKHYNQWRYVTEYTYDAEGWPVRKDKSLYLSDYEKPLEVTETVYFPQSEHPHYKRQTEPSGDGRYVVYNKRSEFVATVSGDGKLISEEKTGNVDCWAPLLKEETPDEARARLAKAAQEKETTEKAADDAAEQEIADSEALVPYVFPQTILDALPADLDATLPQWLPAVVAAIRKGHFKSDRHLSLLLSQLSTVLGSNSPKTDVVVAVVDEKGDAVPDAKITLQQIRMPGNGRGMRGAAVSEKREPMSRTQGSDAQGRAVFNKIDCCEFLHLTSLFYTGKMPEPTLRVSVKADGYEDAAHDFCNVDKVTLALAKQAVSVIAAVADDPEMQIEGDRDGNVKKRYASNRLAKTLVVPEENRHEQVQVKIVLKRHNEHAFTREPPAL